MFNKLILLLFVFSTPGVYSQMDSSEYVFRRTQDELKLIEKGFLSRVESERIETTKRMISTWDKIVADPKIINFAFDSLKEVSILTSKDRKFKLITWNLNKDDGTHAFFGYLLVNNSKKIKKGLFRHETIQSYEYFKLIDISPTVKYPETYVGQPSKWFGMLYYSIIECDGYYTLLGYDPNDKLVRRKFVDVLYFKEDGSPVFGKDVFKFPKKNPKRLMFEYSSDVSMSLKYNDRKNQIIYSHLAPRELGNILEGLPQYYGPDGSFDALEQKKDKWITLEDVDARNEKSKNDKAKKPDPKEQKPIFKPK